MSTLTLLRPLAQLRLLNRATFRHYQIPNKIHLSLFSRNFSTTRNVNSADRRYSKKHEWVSMEGDVGTVGISDHAQESLGDIVFCQMPEIGSSIAQFEEAGAVESVKAASEVYSPVGGEVLEVNEKLNETPALINKSCYENGWMYKLKVSKMEDLKELMAEKDYQDYIKTSE